MEIRIIEAGTVKEMNQFIDFPKELYHTDENFIFEPIAMQKEFLSKKNPFFRHSEATCFLAKSGERVVGRVAVIDNTVHNAVYREMTGFFGLFESIENYEVTRLLLDKVVEKCREKGFRRIIGPTNLTTNDSCGLLISGFDSPPVVMMPYNKDYYDSYLQKYGFKKEMDLSSYYIGDQVLTSELIRRLAIQISDKLSASGISVRTINYKKLEQEVVQMREVYNESNRDNWGFIPLSETEFNHTARQFRQFVAEKLILIVEKDRRQIGFIVALPDINQVFGHMRSGKLFPLGFVKFLLYKRKINNSRILILGVLDAYRNLGIDLLLYMVATPTVLHNMEVLESFFVK